MLSSWMARALATSALGLSFATGATAATTTMALTSSNANPYVNQSVTLTATVSPNAATGPVAFKDGASTITGCSAVALSTGVATCTTSFTTVSTHSVSASYGGDGTYTGSSGSINEVVKALNVTTTTLTPSANPIALGKTQTLVATVAGSFPTGTVQFTDGGANLGSAVQIVNGQATYSSAIFTAGGHAYGATYSGDPTNAASTGNTVVNASGNSTRTLLKVSPTAATPASQVALAATVLTNGGALTGTVTFRDGGTILQTVVMSGSHASWTQSFSLGLHTLTASYSGDAYSDPSASLMGVVQVSSDGSTQPNSGLNIGFEYDAEGNLKKVTDPNGAVTQTDYDSLSRATTVTQPVPASGQAAPKIGLSYDLQDQTTKVVDPRNLATNYTVDGLGNASAQSSPDTGATNRAFYDNGLLKTSTDARNKTTTYTYDALDRPKTVSYSDGGTGITYNYDAGVNGKGHLTSVTDESGSTTLTYDGIGRIATKTQVAGPSGAQKSFGVIYTWGTSGAAAGKLQSIQYPSGAQVIYDFDAAGHVKTVSVLGADGVTTQVLTGLAFTPFGLPKSWAWGSGTSYLRSFDDLGRLSSYPLGDPSGTGISAGVRRTLLRDAASRIIGYSHSTPAKWDQLFHYDGLDRLVSANLLQGNTYGYSYDATGNRTQLTINGAPYASTVSTTSNQYTNVATAAGGSTVQGYDTAGNLSSDAAGTYTYSGRGRLQSQSRSGNTFSYLYNAFEQRVYKGGPTSVITTGVAYYVYDDFGHLIGEYDATGKALYETVYIGDMPVAALTAPAIGQTTVSYIYADHLNTARVIVRPADQAILWQWGSNEPFGQSQANSNPKGLGGYTYNPRLPGQVADVESGWFYNWHRDYNPALGRYVQSDPIGLDGGINTYGYAGGNSLSNVDPDGKFFFLLIPAVEYGLGYLLGDAALVGGLGYLAHQGVMESRAIDRKRAGTIAANYIERAKRQACPPDPPKDPCAIQEAADNEVCGNLPFADGSRRRCYASAAKRLAACEAKRPVEPLSW